MTNSTALTTIREMSGYTLANMADTGTPDNGTECNYSYGADMLDTVRLSFIEYVDYVGTDYTEDGARDAGHEIVDGAIPIYTGQVFATLVDLDAWAEDITELGEFTDMLSAANAALYLVSSRLWDALVAEYAELTA
jgi:hypothetical protein